MEKAFLMISSVLGLLAAQFKKPESTVGVKETTEAIQGVNEIALFICEKLKDGVQVSDALDFYKHLTEDEEFKAVITKSYEGIKLIPAEMKDIDAGEAIEMAKIQIDFVPRYIETFKKNA